MCFTQAEQGDYTRESVAFTVLDEYNTLMQPESNDQQPATPGWEYKPNSQEASAPQFVQPSPHPVSKSPAAQPEDLKNGVTWTASEFVAYQKSKGWYVILALVGIAAVGFIYLVTKDMISVSIAALVMIVLGVTAARKPRTLTYQVDNTGIHIGSKSYSYNNFKSFSIIDEGVFNSIALTPLKRFMPTMSVYYDPSDEEKIIAVLTSYLPFVEGEKDAVDRFLHKIRF